ncbi:MAG TPA: DUF1697 domain-containing protein [Bacteroidia bacterium]|jgi:uncharacterized protein (DUF1697 family)|nr:DUF1697 domain-containing protein [Bacteroidia bacterium]
MIRYVTFLRGINVSGQKLIKMDELNRIMSTLKLKEVKTFIQSGNVLFNSPETNTEKLSQQITKKLKSELGYDVPVVIRTIDQLRLLIEQDPFKKIKEGDDIKLYVSFLPTTPLQKIKAPILSPKKDVKILSIHDGDICCLGLPLPNGTYGFPNLFIEKTFGMPATTRNWNTVNKVSL